MCPKRMHDQRESVTLMGTGSGTCRWKGDAVSLSDPGRTCAAPQYAAVPYPPAAMTDQQERPRGRGLANGHGHVSVPVVKGLVRSRLTARMDDSDLTRLCVVVAPAGAGKTTLLAHWAQSAPA